MRAGVPSEEPPNFWTRIGRGTDLGRAARGVAPGERRSSAMRALRRNITLPRQPFRQEHCAFAGAELGVVREHHVLDPLEHRFIANPADGHRHPIAGIAIAAWLRSERIRIDTEQAVRRRWQTREPIDAER